jgi:hypothetical protein
LLSSPSDAIPSHKVIAYAEIVFMKTYLHLYRFSKQAL